MYRDSASIQDIVDHAELALEFVTDLSRADFLRDEKTQAAVIYQIAVIGEAVKRLSPGFRADHPQLPWKLMAGMRDHLIHGYDDVDYVEVWKTTTIDLPTLVDKLRPLLKASGSST